VVLRAALEMSGRGIHVLPVKADKAIAATLSAINANRCSPPLEQTEMDSILKSTCRYAPDTAAPHVNGEVHAELDTFALAVYGAEWRGKAGKTDGDVLRSYGPTISLTGFPTPTYPRQQGTPTATAHAPITTVLRSATAPLPVYRSLVSR
jgi:hypothetical protein